MDTALKKSICEHYEKGRRNTSFIPGKSLVPVSGKVFDKEELIHGVEAVLDGWWTEGRFAAEFEKEFAKTLGVRYVTLVNSGSSANLIALARLRRQSLGKERFNPEMK